MIPVRKIAERYRRARDLRTQYDSLFKELGRFFLPKKDDFWTSDRKGANRHRHIVDNSGLRVIKNLSRDVTKSLVPDGQKWIDIMLVNELMMGLDEDQLHGARVMGEQLTDAYDRSLRMSNLQDAVYTCATQFFTYGTCAVKPVFMAGKLHFMPLPTDRIYLSAASDGSDPDVFWDRNATVREVLQAYPHYARVSMNLQKEYHENSIKALTYAYIKNIDSTVDEIVFVRRGAADDGISSHSPTGIADNDAIIHYVRHEPGRRPVIVGRMDIPAGEPWGKGVGEEMLTQVQIINTMIRDLLAASAYHFNPAFLVGPGVEANPSTIKPGTMIPVSDKMSNQNVPVMPLQVGGNPMIGYDMMSDLRNQVMSLNAQLPMPNDVASVRSATEWLTAQTLNSAELDNHVRRFTTALMRPMLEQGVNVLRDMGLFPQEVTVSGDVFSMEIKSDQERERKMFQLRRVMAAFEMIGMANHVGPIGHATVDQTKLIREGMESLDLSGAALSPSQAYAIIQQMMQQQQQAEQQQQQQQGQAA